MYEADVPEVLIFKVHVLNVIRIMRIQLQGYLFMYSGDEVGKVGVMNMSEDIK